MDSGRGHRGHPYRPALPPGLSPAQVPEADGPGFAGIDPSPEQLAQLADEKYTVVEGNRRLAALEILHGSPEADGLGFAGIDPSPEQLEQLAEIPCSLISDRDRIHAYIGFRHIGGLKTWPTEAKARYLLAEVRRLVGEDFTDPFRELGRRVGSNAQGVGGPYLRQPQAGQAHATDPARDA